MKKNSRLVYFNGSFVQEDEAKISIYDSALMFGDMVFEMTRSFKKEHFKLKEHIDRLFLGLKILKINLKISKDELIKICEQTAEANDHLFNKNDEHRLMIDVSRGILGIYEDVTGLQKGPNIIVADFPLRWTVKGMGELFNKGINMVITSQRVIPSHLMDPKIKNRSRLFYLNANIEASLFKGENNWALLLDPDGYIAEGTGDNFFIVKDDILYTPRDHTVLNGITRQTIIDISEDLDLEVFEKDISVDDVKVADEAFFTGTAAEVTPVVQVDQSKIGDGMTGKITKKVQKEYFDLIRGKNTKYDHWLTRV